MDATIALKTHLFSLQEIRIADTCLISFACVCADIQIKDEKPKVVCVCLCVYVCLCCVSVCV